MYEQWRTRQTNIKKQVWDITVNSSSRCCHLSVLAFFKCRLYLCFCLTHALLSSANLNLSKPICITKKKKKKTKTKMSGLFSLSEHDRWKIEGEGKHSRLRRQLWNLGEHTATNLGFAVVHCGKSGWHTVVFQEEREREWEKMAANEVGGLWSIVLTCLQ